MCWDQETKKWCGNGSTDPVDLETDVLAAFSSLQSVVVVCAIRQARFGHYTHTIPREQAQELIDAWKSKADVIRFTT